MFAYAISNKIECIVKPVLSGHSKIDKTKALKSCGSFMQVKSTAECSRGAFCSTFDLHYAIIGLEFLGFSLLLSGCLRQVLLLINIGRHKTKAICFSPILLAFLIYKK